MHNYQSLNRIAEKIINYITAHTAHLNPPSVEIVFPMMQALQHMFPEWVIHSCTFKHPHTRFVSDNCERIFGYPIHQLRDMHNTLGLFSCIHEDDVEDIQNCFSYIENFLKCLTPEEYKQLRFVFQYRLRHYNGNYLTVRDEKASLTMNESTVLYYCVLKDISAEKIYSGVKLEIYKHGENFEKVTEYYPGRERLKLSKRENELVGLIQRGLTTKEIANVLKISQHTARNIKQKMFEKFKVSNTIELLNRTIYYN